MAVSGQCNKTKYATEDAANKDIQRIKKTSTRSTIPIRSYYCGDCTAWHLTSKEPHLVTQLKSVSKELEDLKSDYKRLDTQYNVIFSENKVLKKSVEKISNENKSLIGKNKSLLNENMQFRKNKEIPKTPPNSV